MLGCAFVRPIDSVDVDMLINKLTRTPGPLVWLHVLWIACGGCASGKSNASKAVASPGLITPVFYRIVPSDAGRGDAHELKIRLWAGGYSAFRASEARLEGEIFAQATRAGWALQRPKDGVRKPHFEVDVAPFIVRYPKAMCGNILILYHNGNVVEGLDESFLTQSRLCFDVACRQWYSGDTLFQEGGEFDVPPPCDPRLERVSYFDPAAAHAEFWGRRIDAQRQCVSTRFCLYGMEVDPDGRHGMEQALDELIKRLPEVLLSVDPLQRKWLVEGSAVDAVSEG